MKLHIADGLDLPIEAVTESIGILAKRRAGKSTTARRLTEQLHRAHQQVVVCDPKGDWWGLLFARDGKQPGLPFIVLGGEHGHAPLEVGAGEIVARLVVEDRVSLILDLSKFRKSEVATFMTAFMETLYRLKAQEMYRTPMMLVIDEADAIAPQKPYKGEERMLGAAEDLVRRGGQRGIGVTMLTQRSAVLNKNVLTQIGILIALRTIAPQDLAAIDDWIDVHGTPEQRKELMASLPSLPTGAGWVWAPGWPNEKGIFHKADFLLPETFDSSATPKAGEKRIEPKNAADVDLEALKVKMAATIEKAKADDPKLLRAEIQKLRRELDKRHAGSAKTVDQSALHEAERTGYERGRSESFKRLLYGSQQLEKISALLVNANERLAGVGAELKNNATAAPARAVIGVDRANGPDRTVRVSVRSGPEGTRTFEALPEACLPKGERIILTAIAQHTEGVTREQLTVLTGYKRSSRDAYLQRIGERGFTEASGDRIVATDVGIAALGGDFEPLPTGDALREHWLRRLPEGERRVLEVLVRAYPKAVDRERISEATDYKRSSRDTYLQRLGARRLISTEGRGEVRASEELFG